ncbi:MAG: hypothetical protein WDN27_00525 [Candidatus Saccharibacteria bacterium]
MYRLVYRFANLFDELRAKAVILPVIAARQDVLVIAYSQVRV